MTRMTSYPDDHWRMQVDIPYSMGVLQDSLFFLCGQGDFEGQGQVAHPDDLYRQSEAAIRHIERIVSDLGCDMADLTKLCVYYVNDDSINQIDYINYLSNLIDLKELPVITLVPLAHFFYSGLMVEIDAYGIKRNGASRTVIPSDLHPFSQVVQQGEMAFMGAVTAENQPGKSEFEGDIVNQSHIVLEKMDGLLDELGATRNDIVKINNWYVGEGTAEQWAESARVRADYYPDPGPVATGLPVRTLYPSGMLIQTDCWLMIAGEDGQIEKRHSWPEDHWDWPIYLPFKHGLKCRNLIFMGGQVSMDKHANVLDKDDMAKQSYTSMENIRRILSDFDADYSDIIKMNAFYAGRGAEDLHRNLNIRSSFFTKPGPASTGIPLDHLAYPGMLTEFEAIAMVDE